MNTAKSTGTGGTPTRVIALLAFAAFVSSANLRVCDPLLPQVAGELAVSIGTAAWIVTAFAVSYGILQIVVGPLGDALGKLPMVLLGSLWAGIATLLCAAMPSLGSLVTARAFAGAGGAAIIPVAIAWIGDAIPYERRQPVLARFASGQILGLVFGQAIGGLLGELIGWRGTMLVLGVVHIAAGLLLVIEARRARAGPVIAHRPHWVQAARQALDIIRTPWARVVLAGAFLEGMLMFGAFAYVGADLHHRFGAGLGLVGVTIAAFGAGALLYSLCAGFLVPRFGQPMMVALGSISLALGYATLTFMPWFWLAAPAVALLGLGFYMLHNTLQTEATQMAPETRGLAVSMFAIMLFTGQATGVALAGPVVDRWSARPVFLFAALALLGVAWWLRRQLLRRMRAPRG